MWEGRDPVNRFNPKSWMTVVTSTFRPTLCPRSHGALVSRSFGIQEKEDVSLQGRIFNRKRINEIRVVCDHSVGTLISVCTDDNGNLDGFLYEKALYIQTRSLLWNTTHSLNYLLVIICIILIDRMVEVCTALFFYNFEIKTTTMMPCTRFHHLNVYAAL